MPEQEKFNLSLHAKCLENFNARGEALLQEKVVTPRTVKQPTGFVPDMPIVAAFKLEELSGYLETLVLPGGRVLECTFPHDGNDVGFKGEGYKNFARLCEKIQSTKPLNQYISLQMLSDLMFKWVRERHTGSTKAVLMEYIVPKCEEAIRDYEIWIPIAYTYISRDLPFEKVTLRTFSPQMFNALRDIANEIAKTKNFPDLDKYLLMLDHYQNKLQGMAAATIFIQAEPRRAYEIALEETEKAVAILRLFSKAAFIPEVGSCCVPFGQKSAQAQMYFGFFEGMLAFNTDGIIGTEQTHFTVGPEQLNLMNEVGVIVVIRLFYKEARTPFEEAVFNSMMMYSKGLLASNPSDKLMYIFSALESLLLKNDSENIQQNVADRIAFTVASDARQRMEVVENYKAAYNLRSKYVHHAQTVADFDTLTIFLQTVWKFYFGVVHRELSKYTDKEAFLKSFDLMKYSGTMPQSP